MVICLTEREPPARLFIDLWIRATTETKAQRVLRRAAARGDVVEEPFPDAYLDEERGLWKYSLAIELPAAAPAGILWVLKGVQSLATAFSVYNFQYSNDRWAIDGSADEMQLPEPGLVFVQFSARSEE
jgi:hypothetical protein